MTPEKLHHSERFAPAVFLLFTHNFYFSSAWLNNSIYDYNEMTLSGYHAIEKQHTLLEPNGSVLLYLRQ